MNVDATPLRDLRAQLEELRKLPLDDRTVEHVSQIWRLERAIERITGRYAQDIGPHWRGVALRVAVAHADDDAGALARYVLGE